MKPSPKPSVNPGEHSNKKQTTLTVTIYDKQTNVPIPNAVIKVVNTETNEVFTITVDKDGKANIEVPAGTYTVYTEHVPKGYSKPSPLKVDAKSNDNTNVNIKVSNKSNTKNNSNSETNSNTAPKTGEQSLIPIFLVIALLSGGAIAVCKKKRLI